VSTDKPSVSPAGGRHPDVELLDAYADGERTPGAVDRHVRGCSVCQQAVVALRDVGAELARLAPISMPPDVARRIQDALTAAPPPASPSTGKRRPPPRVGLGTAALRPSQTRPVLAAVCLLVVVAGGGLVVALTHTARTSSSTAGPATLTASVRADGEPDLAATTTSVRVAMSLATLDPTEIAQHARDLLGGRVPIAALVTMTPGASMAGVSSWAAVATPDLLACYQRLASVADGSLLALDEVSYQGRPAALVVLDTPDLNTPAEEGQIELTVLDLGCDVAHLRTATMFAEQSTKAA
jgi:hypothetical protein